MKSVVQVIVIICVSLLLVFGATMFLNGWAPVSRDTHPACDQLPTTTDAAEALMNSQDLVNEIKKLGNDIVVEVGKPCADNQDRGLVMIRYHSRSDRDAIAELLGRRDGFGVPVHLEKH